MAAPAHSWRHAHNQAVDTHTASGISLGAAEAPPPHVSR